MFRITKIFKFCAAHYIDTLQNGHKCKKLHGHNFEAHFTFASKKLDAHGFIVDVCSVDVLKRYINNVLDHSTLNDVVKQPSSENLAKHLFELAKHHGFPIEKVKIVETDTIYAEYSDN